MKRHSVDVLVCPVQLGLDSSLVSPPATGVKSFMLNTELAAYVNLFPNASHTISACEKDASGNYYMVCIF